MRASKGSWSELVRCGLVAVAVVSPAAATHASGSLPVAAMNQLRTAPAGTYRITSGRLDPVPAESVPLAVQADVYRAPDGTTRVPLVIGAEAPTLSTIEVRVEPVATGRSDAAGRRPTIIEIADISGQVRELRDLSLPPGSYELVGMIARRARDGSIVGSVVREALAIPNLSDHSLAATPLVLGAAVAEAGEGGRSRPFVFGSSNVIPAPLKRFRPSDDLHVAFRVQGWQPSAQGPARPNLEVEYVFQQRVGDRLRFFNKTKPQLLNDRTVVKTLSASDLLASGLTVPLAPFPAGEFSVIVRVRDTHSAAVAIQEARFIVQQ